MQIQHKIHRGFPSVKINVALVKTYQILPNHDNKNYSTKEKTMNFDSFSSSIGKIYKPTRIIALMCEINILVKDNRIDISKTQKSNKKVGKNQKKLAKLMEILTLRNKNHVNLK